ncbi:MAG: response regulator [Glaciecola sp.]|jgi:two-component system sensor histidine kinase BarA
MQQRLQQLPPINVLAVDDVPFNLKLLQMWLKDSSCTLHTATSAEEAIKLCADIDYDIILMDIQMPEMDGVTATQHIRRTPLNIGTPIIALTAHGFSEDRAYFLSRGFDDFIAKPIDLHVLLGVIETWCAIPSATPIQVPAPEECLKEAADCSVTFSWELAIKRANGNNEIAKELLSDFIMQLPKMLRDLKRQFAQSKFSQLHATVHKLHGACCYTGVPRLQALCLEVETKHRRNIEQNLHDVVDKLWNEGEKVISEGRLFLAELNTIQNSTGL